MNPYWWVSYAALVDGTNPFPAPPVTLVASERTEEGGIYPEETLLRAAVGVHQV